MNILGIYDGAHDSGACLVSEGKILSAINEERLTRIKLDNGFPKSSLEEVLRQSRVSGEDVDILCVGGVLTPQIYLRRFRSLQKRFKLDKGNFYFKKTSFKNLVLDFVQFRSGITGLTTNSKAAKIEERFLPFVLRRDLPKSLLKKPIYFIDHHLAHVAAAYFTQEREEVLSITADGIGDGLSLTINRCQNRNIEQLHTMRYPHSFGWFYSLLTAYLGFKPFQDEGKVVGLAAYGDHTRVDIDFPFKNIDGRIVYTQHFGLAGRQFLKSFDKYKKEDIASWLQFNIEKFIVALIDEWVKKTDLHDIVLSGGLFANIKLNQRINELDSIQSLYIFPHMGDGGLALAAALYFLKPEPTRLKDLFLGVGYSDIKMKDQLDKNSLDYRYIKQIEEEIVRLLMRGKAVARFNGRFEYGPRALGNRSILYEAKDAKKKEWLNERLKRTAFMPFAPTTLDEFADKCYKRIKGAKYTAKFMTISFDCKDYMQETSPLAVHIDGTVRPQILSEEDNPSLYKILKEYHKLSGIPSIINTSFNIHEEPIVSTPEEAIEAFKEARLDYLAIGNYLVEKEKRL